MIFEERVEVYIHKGRNMMFLVVNAVLITLALWLLAEGVIDVRILGVLPISGIWIGGLLLLIFFYSSFILIRRLMRNMPVIVLDEKGIYDATLQSEGFDIPWQNVEAVKCSKTSGRSFITVILKEPEAFIDQIPEGVKKKMILINHGRYGSPVNIRTGGLSMNTDELHQAIQAHWKRYAHAGF